MRARRYWAFISYSRADADRAAAVHRRLERFVVPRRARGLVDPRGPGARRVRPVFRDVDEMVAAGRLTRRLTDAIEDSVAMVLVASPASAASRYVDLEVRHFLATHGEDRLVILAVHDGTDHPPLPPGMAGIEEPVWVDLRGGARLGQRDLVRVAATVVGVAFDELWRRHVRRMRKLVALWCAAAVVAATVVGYSAWQARTAAARSPEQQRAQFLEWYQRDRSVPEVTRPFELDVVRVDDLDNDGLMDFFVVNRTPEFCGSGGCLLEVFLTTAPGRYAPVLQQLGGSDPRVRPAANGAKEIITVDNFVSREPLYSVHALRGQAFALDHYEFCDGVIFEMCQPTVISPVSAPGRVAGGTAFRERPDPSGREVTVGAGQTVDGGSWDPTVIGAVEGVEWYLAEIWKGYCGFVPKNAVGR
ncbi:toll/interleukin-1 receptor domain-containing protein [Saccharothrix obliqua]|uniref:toll/interleukin-1 receptor domain-containing protein n=1 Tax=Saccharothrix obliqua TaxID=2861747 RepID=UPI001C5DDF92|nr:toll/interleukin-1 receptor domain-containing protein [Saccharothrix obliqua]MBW4716750.1 toll/interleukin-1 receptor domain-containing protein [Saccharothrix obliqua]